MTVFDEIYGYRAKLGLIYPSSSFTMEPEFYAMSPAGVITCTTRVPLECVSVEALTRMGTKVVEGAELLKNSRVDSVVLGCTSGSFVNGIAYNDDMIDRMQQASGVPCTTTSTAVVTALRQLELNKICVLTPYPEEVNERAKRYLEQSGFNVCDIRGLGLIYDTDIDGRTLELNYRYARECDTNEADAIVILCTAMRTVPVIEQLEQDLNKPVVTAIQASFWHALRLAGVMEPVCGFGSLLRE